MDYSKYGVLAESIKVGLGFSIIYFHNLSWFDLNGIFVIAISIYFIIAISCLSIF